MTLLWKKHYIPMVLSARKTMTRRLKRPAVKVGGEYYIKTSLFEHLPERIRVDALYTQRLGDMTEEDAAREGAENLHSFVKDWKTLTGTWDPENTVWVVEFHLDDSSCG